MFVCKELTGMYRVCEIVPENRKCYWYPTTDTYFNISSTLSEILFPKISENDLLNVDIKFGEGDTYYVCCDESGIYHICKNSPKFYSIYSKLYKQQFNFWDPGKEFMCCTKEYGVKLFGNLHYKDLIKIKIKFV